MAIRLFATVFITINLADDEGSKVFTYPGAPAMPRPVDTGNLGTD